jgi:DNA-binding GntR family transcriptional regulator
LPLCPEGLLAQQPHRGFAVLPVTERHLADVANVQAHVGGKLAARAAINITDDQVRELNHVQAELEQAYAGDDHDWSVRLNHEFHRAIIVTADSPKLAQLMSQITRYAPESVFPTIEGCPRQSLKDHRRVLGALAKHDEALACAAMSEHPADGAVPLTDHLVSRGVVAQASPPPPRRRRPKGAPRIGRFPVPMCRSRSAFASSRNHCSAILLD